MTQNQVANPVSLPIELLGTKETKNKVSVCKDYIMDRKSTKELKDFVEKEPTQSLLNALRAKITLVMPVEDNLEAFKQFLIDNILSAEIPTEILAEVYNEVKTSNHVQALTILLTYHFQNS